MTTRRATDADVGTLHELWRAFAREVPAPPHVDVDEARELDEITQIVGAETALIAEEDGAPIGFALARRRGSRLTGLMDLYVVPGHRRRGVAASLVRAVVQAAREGGSDHIDLEVQSGNAAARAAYARWGFRENLVNLVAPVDELERRLAATGHDDTFGSIHVQTDDEPAVERAVRQFVPRLPGGSRGSVVAPPRNGWVAVYDDVCDRDQRQLQRLGRELSERLGAVVAVFGVTGGAVVRYALLDRGTVMDEYASVPEHNGPLPPGDVVALAANPRVAARLTGADPERLRATARQAATPADLPPARELAGQVAAALGIEGAEHGWADAPDIPGARTVER